MHLYEEFKLWYNLEGGVMDKESDHRAFDSVFIVAFCLFLWWVVGLIPEIPHLQSGINIGLWTLVAIGMLKGIWNGEVRFLRDIASDSQQAPQG